MNIKLFMKLIMLLLILISCNNNSHTFYQADEGASLLIQPPDLPASWKLQTSWHGPLGMNEAVTEWRNIYIHPASLGRSIVSSATIFENEAEAIQFWKLFSADQNTGAISPCLVSLEQSAQSSLADQLEILCFNSSIAIEQMVTYSYFVIARYGNVVSTFGAEVTEGNNLTKEQANQLGVLRQTDMEALLALLDEKFQQAGQVK